MQHGTTCLVIACLVLMVHGANTPLCASSFRPEPEIEPDPVLALAERAMAQLDVHEAGLEQFVVPVTRGAPLADPIASLFDGVHAGPWSAAILRVGSHLNVAQKSDIEEVVEDGETMAEPFRQRGAVPDVKDDLQRTLTPEALQQLGPAVEPDSRSVDDSIAASLDLEGVHAPLSSLRIGGGAGFDVSAAPDHSDHHEGGNAVVGIIVGIIFAVVLVFGYIVRMKAGSTF